MANDEVFGTRRRRAVFKRADFSIGATDSRFEHTQLDVRCRQDLRFRLFDNADLFLTRRDCDSFHRGLLTQWLALLDSYHQITTEEENMQADDHGNRSGTSDLN